jgi:hypothetical protein
VKITTGDEVVHSSLKRLEDGSCRIELSPQMLTMHRASISVSDRREFVHRTFEMMYSEWQTVDNVPASEYIAESKAMGKCRDAHQASFLSDLFGIDDGAFGRVAHRRYFAGRLSSVILYWHWAFHSHWRRGSQTVSRTHAWIISAAVPRLKSVGGIAAACRW